MASKRWKFGYFVKPELDFHVALKVPKWVLCGPKLVVRVVTLRVSRFLFRDLFFVSTLHVSGFVLHPVRFMRHVFGVASPRKAVACGRGEAPIRLLFFMFHVPRFGLDHSPCCTFDAARFPLYVSRFLVHVSRLPQGLWVFSLCLARRGPDRWRMAEGMVGRATDSTHPDRGQMTYHRLQAQVDR